MRSVYELAGAAWDRVPVEDTAELCHRCGHELAVHDVRSGCDECPCVHGVDGCAVETTPRHTFLVEITLATGDSNPGELMPDVEDIVDEAMGREAESGRWPEFDSARVECVDAWPVGEGSTTSRGTG